jgi:hypothetical protein
VKDPEETLGRRVMHQTRIRSDQIPVRSGLSPFSLRFIIGISTFYCLYDAIVGKIPIYYPFLFVLLSFYTVNTHLLTIM